MKKNSLQHGFIAYTAAGDSLYCSAKSAALKAKFMKVFKACSTKDDDSFIYDQGSLHKGPIA